MQTLPTHHGVTECHTPPPRRPWLALALATLLGACTNVQPPLRPTPDPAATVAAEFNASGPPALQPGPAATAVAGLNIERWWLSFDDAALAALIEAALAHNADLTVAAARLREARAQFDEARGAQAPSLDLQASSGRARRSAESLGLPAGQATQAGSSHKVALSGQYEIDLWGRLSAGSDAASQRLAAQAWARAAIEWSLSAQVAEAHFACRALLKQLQISEAVRAGRARMVALRRAELGAGVSSEFELRRAEAELAAAESTLASLHRQQLRLESTLSLLVGTPIAQLSSAFNKVAAGLAVARAAAAQPLDPGANFTPRLPQGAVAELLVRRPDLRQAEAQLAATSADIQAARAASLPALRLSGSVGSDVRELSKLFSGPGLAWSLAGSVVHSIFDGGRNAARVGQAQARNESALAAYRKSVASALIEVRETYAAFETAERALNAERQRVAALAQAERLARLGHAAGVLTQLDALDAERNHFQAQLAEADAYRERLLGQVAAFKALGGGHAGIERRAAAN